MYVQFLPINGITDNRISNLLQSDITGPILLEQYTKDFGKLNHSFSVLTFTLAQSNPIIQRHCIYVNNNMQCLSKKVKL